MGKVIILRGLPASGKSTRAREIVSSSGNFVRVNRDLLREMVHFGEWKPQREEGIIKSEMGVAAFYLVEEKKSVVVDDTNLSDKTIKEWVDFIEALNKQCGTRHTVSTEWVDTPMYECLKRDYNRAAEGGRFVSRYPIVNMALQYKKDPQEYKYVLCDLDGTLADIKHRLHYVKGKDKKDWKSFFAEISGDSVRTDVLEKVLNAISPKENNRLVIVTARPEDQCKKETIRWLESNGINPFTLIMRRGGDRRDDTDVKRDMLNRYFPDRSRIVKVFDDRPSVIRMWREEGLEVEDVGSGVEF